MNAISERRQDIEGLRAVAVLAVVFFHFGWGWIPGGYVGVDVFFVISGYLITKQIVEEIERTGELSFRGFYLRRVRRIFPALLITLFASAIAAAVIFSPIHLEQFGAELVSSILSISNIYFYIKSGYFDTESLYKPLLHTWSLSVEEQFYLVWPAVLLLSIRYLGAKYAIYIILLISILSLISSEYFSDGFFITPLRMFEFGIGAILVWLPKDFMQKNWTCELILLLGLFAVMFSSIVFDQGTPFPSVYALLPCFGAAAVIVGGQASFFGLALRNSVSVWIGKISYSLYLVHWPLVVFYNYSVGGAIDGEGREVVGFSDVEAVVLFAIMLVLAYLLYEFVEQPFRGGRVMHFSRGFAVGASLVSAILVLAGTHAYATKGWTWRLSSEELALLEMTADRAPLPLGVCQYSGRRMPEKWEECYSTHGKAIVLFGDSHGNDLISAIGYYAQNTHIYNYSRGNCDINNSTKRADDCKLEEMRNFISKNRDKIEAVFYTESGGRLVSHRDGTITKAHIKRIENIVEYLSEIKSTLGLPVVWIGPARFPNFKKELIGSGAHVNINILLENEFDMDPVEAYIEPISKSKDIIYVSKLKAQEPYKPNYLIVDGRFTYADSSHWSQYGAAIFGKRLLETSPVLREFLDSE